jgi:hypothetical protein
MWFFVHPLGLQSGVAVGAGHDAMYYGSNFFPFLHHLHKRREQQHPNRRISSGGRSALLFSPFQPTKLLVSKAPLRRSGSGGATRRPRSGGPLQRRCCRSRRLSPLRPPITFAAEFTYLESLWLRIVLPCCCRRRRERSRCGGYQASLAPRATLRRSPPRRRRRRRQWMLMPTMVLRH